MTHPRRLAKEAPGFGASPRCEWNGAVGGQTEITFRLLDGTQAAAHAEDLLALHAEVYGEQPDDGFARRFAVLRRQPGFVLAEARHGGYLVGYALGMPLRPSTSWWRERQETGASMISSPTTRRMSRGMAE